jgi:hypothetical protein
MLASNSFKGGDMAGIFSFTCSSCDEIHEGSPSFSFRAPGPYLDQPAEVQEAGHLGSDLCHYEDADGMHFFIRVLLEVPIHGVADPFLWGVWVSLSEQNYARYIDTFDAPNTGDRYFGWFCNHLPYYPNSLSLKTEVHPRAGNTRPFIVLEETDHPLSIDYHRGISIAPAQEIAEAVMHG